MAHSVTGCATDVKRSWRGRVTSRRLEDMEVPSGRGRAKIEGAKVFRFQLRWIVLTALMPWAAADVHAQVVHSHNGVEVWAWAGIVEYGAETCQVLEEHESAASYRRKRVNQGQPIDIWRLNYSVYNGSDYLITGLKATYRVEAHEPPCTLWGLPSRTHLPERVRLRGASGEITRDGDNPLARGDTLTATSYMYVFRGHQAWFADWHIDYDFTAAPITVDGVATPTSPSPQTDPVPDSVPAFVPPDIPPVDPAHVFSDCPECPRLVRIPAGTFTMGSQESEQGRGSDEGPQRVVTIGTPFAAGMHEVTFAQWDACVRAGGCEHEPDDEGWGRGDRPVINVNWTDARMYLRWLSQHTGQRYRLLSEAEWEYVARAGSRTARYWGESPLGQCLYANGDEHPLCADEYEFTAPVGVLSPNAFGLHDVSGNVAEWTQDCWDEDYSDAPSDGSAREVAGCTNRVVRGGSWTKDVSELRSAAREWNHAAFRFHGFGFRVARELSSE